MIQTTTDALQTPLAVIAFAPLFLAPGFLLATALNPSDLRSRSLAEQLLWSLVLSLPSSLVVSSILPRILPGPLLLGPLLPSLFGILTLAALLLAGRFLRGRPLLFPRRSSWAVLAAIVALILYVLLLTSPLQRGSRLFESVNVSDWSVRVPLVAASVRGGVPPPNPFFTVAGHPQSSRYYFYWYALCALVARSAHLPARACLAASTLWSALSIVALLFLSLEYLGEAGASLRRQCLLALSLCCVMGIDILPALAGLFTRPMRLFPEIEWWHNDRIPSFLGAILFAPHHIAGMVCCSTAYLVLLRKDRPSTPAGESRHSHLVGTSLSPNLLLRSLIAGLCFAAAVGDSTYIAFCFAFVGLLYGLDLLRLRRWPDLAALVLAAALAVLLSLPFLHAMLSGPALPPTSGHASNHFFRLTLRDLGDGDRFVAAVSKRLHHRVTNRVLLHTLALPFVAVSLPLEFGFFLVPLALHIRRDLARLRSGDRFSAGERLLWATFLGAAIPALFLSSEPTQGVNDLGRHAGLILRLVTIVWSAPILLPYLERLLARQPLISAAHPTPGQRWLPRVAVVLLVLGLATQAWQILLDRTYLMIFHHTRRNPEMPFAQDSNLAGRYFDLRHGLETVEARLPPGAVVQSNPGSRYQMIVMLYSTHPFAAADISCETAFGGDLRLCKPIVADLEHLFGGPPDIQPTPLAPYITVTAPDAPATTTLAAFQASCRDLHLSAVVAQNSDPAWSIPTSWVWQQTPAFATPRVRIFRCPEPAA